MEQHRETSASSFDQQVALASALVEGNLAGVLVFVPDAILLGGTPTVSVLDHDPLVRAATHCLAPRETPAALGHRGAFVQYAFVVEDRVIVVQQGSVDPRLAFVAMCTREVNLAYVLQTTRLAMAQLEVSIDLAAWGL